VNLHPDWCRCFLLPILYLKLILPQIEMATQGPDMAQEEPFIARQLSHRHSSQGKHIWADLPGEALEIGEARKDI
jgi:hypothetical protein